MTAQDDLNAQIIEAAAQCFERHGIRRSTMQQVADAVGVSRQTIYDHFPSKADLAGAVMLTFTRQCYDEVMAGLDFSLPVGEVIAAAQGDLTRCFRRPRGQMLISPADRELLSKVARHIRILDIGCAEYWGPLLERLRDAGKIRQDIDIPDAARWLYLTNYAYNQHAIFDGEPQARLDRVFTTAGLMATTSDKSG